MPKLTLWRAARTVVEAGTGRDGRRYGLPLPHNKYLVAQGDPAIGPGSYDTEVDTDACYRIETRARGFAWIIERRGISVIQEAMADFEGVGSNCAEISAVVGALLRAQSEGCERLLMRTDNRLVACLLTGANRPVKDLVEDAWYPVSTLLPQFDAVSVAWVSEKSLRKVDRLSKTLLTPATPGSTKPRRHMISRESTGPEQPLRDPSFFREWFQWKHRFP